MWRVEHATGWSNLYVERGYMESSTARHVTCCSQHYPGTYVHSKSNLIVSLVNLIPENRLDFHGVIRYVLKTPFGMMIVSQRPACNLLYELLTRIGGSTTELSAIYSLHYVHQNKMNPGRAAFGNSVFSSILTLFIPHVLMLYNMAPEIYLHHLGTQSTFRLSLFITVLSILWGLSVSDEIKPTKAACASDEVNAATLSCVTDSTGSTLCPIGVDPVATYATIDGGYQWLTDEIETTTESGMPTTETVPVFTATQTN